ncbi:MULTISPECIES: helix-turn-helix transcriptional regulator [Stenotrophomonas]|uniref:Helix-turn-helix transcriptional regulator n=1 Tax=Stenotrophomonas muris TaxID=2963283 RepID=A0ABU5MEY2_9GAMM|nr:helix-turn-helix transcriptional regulator [Stenotrophomonas muris]MBN5070477.1 helix-turn-helix transcriptional regulator [Stenotrophomonas maltophilia]MDZ7511324.1 helix-turn-helix transcriptional regulator [Stenotrophomonas muris]
MDLSTRLRTALARAGVSQLELAKAVGVSAPSVSGWLSGKSQSIRGDALVKAARVLGVPALWLATGEGSIDDAPDTPPLSVRETPPGYLRLELLDGAAGMGAGVVNEEFPEVIRSMDYAEWDIRQRLGYLPKPGRLKLITGRGPSMAPIINNGDVVMVDTAVDYFDGDAIYVINIGGETQIKGLQRRSDGVYIVSANPLFPPYAAPDDLFIAGKAVVQYSARQIA